MGMIVPQASHGDGMLRLQFFENVVKKTYKGGNFLRTHVQVLPNNNYHFLITLKVKSSNFNFGTYYDGNM
jgi:hypothetical protein